MVIPRRARRHIALLLIGVLLFAQLAVAAYACTAVPDASLSGARASAVAGSVAGVEMFGSANHEVGHAAMDAAQQNLCAAHCQSDQQNAGGKPIPDAPAAIPMDSSLRASLLLPAVTLRASTAPRDQLMAGPSRAILHCCFRI